MVAIAEGKGLSKRELKGDVRAFVVAHRVSRLMERPFTIDALIPSSLSVRKTVRQIGDQQCAADRRVQVVGGDYPRSVGLKPY